MALIPTQGRRQAPSRPHRLRSCRVLPYCTFAHRGSGRRSRVPHCARSQAHRPPWSSTHGSSTQSCSHPRSPAPACTAGRIGMHAVCRWAQARAPRRGAAQAPGAGCKGNRARGGARRKIARQHGPGAWGGRVLRC
eukprot:scaffold17310_cov61-Phaeocystis_antarctica.AAC.3